MAKTSASTKNIHRPAPRWFRKMKRAILILADGAAVILIGMGHAENSTAILIIRIGISTVLMAFEALLANGEQYAPIDAQ